MVPHSSTGCAYTLFERTNLTIGAWGGVAGQSNIAGTGGILWFTNLPSAGSQRFFSIGAQVP